IALVWPLQALRYRVLSLRACTPGAEGRAESGGPPLKVTVRETGRRTTAMVWNDPAIRGALSRYLDVAENQHPAKFSIAATVHRRATNSYEPTRRARIRRRRYCRGEVPNQRLNVRKATPPPAKAPQLYAPPPNPEQPP